MTFYGGFARHELMTLDAFAMVICHELGHQFAGYPFYPDSNWSANEGQADYFATHSCLREAWKKEKEENKAFRAVTDPIAQEACNKAWSAEDDRDLCYRIAHAAYQMTRLYADAYNIPPPVVSTPDSTIVNRTRSSHPEPQCRLDTYFQGALCAMSFASDVIPGRLHEMGQESAGAEREASRYSCMTNAGHQIGVRPRCWYKPYTQNLALHTAAYTLKDMGNGNGIFEPGEQIAIDVVAGNGTTQTVYDAKASIASTSPSLEVRNAYTDFPYIASGTAVRAAQPLVAFISSRARCGDLLQANLSISSMFGIEQQQLPVTVGDEWIDVGRSVPMTPIPDGSLEGISFSFDSTRLATVTEAQLHLDVDHKNPYDLIIMLSAPNGKNYMIHQRQSVVRDRNLVFLKDEKSQGRWTLKIVDAALTNKGTLYGWSLRMHKTLCSP